LGFSEYDRNGPNCNQYSMLGCSCGTADITGAIPKLQGLIVSSILKHSQAHAVTAHAYLSMLQG